MTDRATISPQIVSALDEVEVIADLLWAMFLVREGIGGSGGGAVSRTALITQDRLHELRIALGEH